MFEYLNKNKPSTFPCLWEQIPKEQAVTQEKQLLANYLSCSGSLNANNTSGTCLERLTCELHHPASDSSQLEKHVMSM
jgi:hypothetical protein